MTTFVLVPGFWMGGWAWDGVAARLRADGHVAHAVTLTGLDAHADPDPGRVGVADHVGDVLAAIDAAADGSDAPVVLVGHSAGGPLAAAAVDRRPGVLARFVLVDTGVLPDGWGQIDFHPPAGQAAIRAAIGDDPVYPMPSDAEFGAAGSSRAGIDPSTWAAIRNRAVGQPAGTVLEPIPRGAREPRLPKTVVACSFPAELVAQMAAGLSPEMGDPEWSVEELPTGHWPMFSRPDDLAVLLTGLPGART